MNDMRTRLHWIMGLRVALVTLMLGLSLAFQVAKGGRVETFYALILVTYILTIPSAMLLRMCATPAALMIFFWVQVGIDFFLETVLVARTGGIESPFAVLYVMTVAVASLVPRRRVGLLAACFCIILFGILTNIQFHGLIEGWGWLPPSRLTMPETYQTFGVYALALLVVGILGGTLTEQLQQVDQSLIKEGLLDKRGKVSDELVTELSFERVSSRKTFRMPHRLRWGGMSDLGGGLDAHAKMQLNLF